MFRKTLVTSIVALFFLNGCLSQNHRLNKSELRRLADVAPEARGDKVRVVQELTSSDDPPQADRVGGGTVVYVHAPIWVDGRPYHHRHGPTKVVGGGAHGGKLYGASKVAENKKADSKALLILAGIAAVALAATEGARYDGWLKLHPMHPVHLYGPYGGYTVLPLAHIDPQTAAWAHHAIVRETEGQWQYLGRAPLNRKGFTYSLFLGAGEIPVIDLDPDPGFLGHIQFGYFPTHQVGLQIDFGLGWTEDPLHNTIFTSRTSLEVQGYPVQAGPVHAGLFGQLGAANRFDDGIAFDDTSGLFGLGALLQLDLTTRLALTARVGATHSFGEWANELGIGMSIY